MSSAEHRGSANDPEEERRLKLVAEGRHWFELLGEQHLIGTTIAAPDGRQLLAEEFTLIYDKELYEERVHPLYLTLRNDPDNEPLKSALRRMLYGHLMPPDKAP